MFEYRWVDPATGKRHRVRRTPDRGLSDRQVREWAQRLKAGLLLGRIEPEDAASPLVWEAFARYLRSCAHQSPGTLASKRKRFKILVKYLGPTAKVNGITLERVEAFLHKRHHDGASIATCNRYLALIRHFLRWCVRAGLVSSGRAQPVLSMRQSREPDPPIRVLSRDEESKLLAAAAEWFAPMILVALYTGCRQGELIDLDWERVDLEAGVIRVVGKGRKRRTVPLCRTAAMALESLCPLIATGPVFRNRRGDRWQADGVIGAWRRALRRAGIPKATFHDTRSTFATRVARHGASAHQIKALLGHRSIYMALRYVNDAALETRSAVTTLDA